MRSYGKPNRGINLTHSLTSALHSLPYTYRAFVRNLRRVRLVHVRIQVWVRSQVVGQSRKFLTSRAFLV